MKPHDTTTGLALAFALLSLWLASLIWLLSADLNHFSLAFIPVAFLLQTFLYTGLFITAHDAMHGTVAPGYPALNRAIGSVAIVLYALFDYRHLQAKHFEHHRHPAREGDPDYHDGRHTGFMRWYAHFMLGYMSWRQIVGMAIAFNILHHLAGIPLSNLLLFWVAPALLSTAQLFYFGTYLPHRQPAEGYGNPHHARSSNYSAVLSFLACYHFGYHYEHHDHPSVPWWRLPSLRQNTQLRKRTVDNSPRDTTTA